jgi:DNA-binding NarL/FixJ family response regulator
MDKIRCLIVAVPHYLLADLILHITEKYPEIEVVGRVNGYKELVLVLRGQPVDVVVTGIDGVSKMQFIDDLFALAPQIVVVGVMNDGRRLCLCVEDRGPEDLITLMCDLVKRESK